MQAGASFVYAPPPPGRLPGFQASFVAMAPNPDYLAAQAAQHQQAPVIIEQPRLQRDGLSASIGLGPPNPAPISYPPNPAPALSASIGLGPSAYGYSPNPVTTTTYGRPGGGAAHPGQPQQTTYGPPGGGQPSNPILSLGQSLPLQTTYGPPGGGAGLAMSPVRTDNLMGSVNNVQFHTMPKMQYPFGASYVPPPVNATQSMVSYCSPPMASVLPIYSSYQPPPSAMMPRSIIGGLAPGYASYVPPTSQFRGAFSPQPSQDLRRSWDRTLT